MRFSRLVLAACAAACLCAAQAALPAGIKKITTVEGITEYRLDNGLQVLFIPDASSPKVTVNVTYMVGSKHENYGETGMAHLLEHMVFKGTKNRGNVMKSLQEHGAQFNGTTSTDRTNYYETLAPTDENLEWALRMEADRMVNALVAKSDLDTEMTVVRNEYEMGENSPGSVLMKRTMSAAYEWHNYGKTTIGARSDIENVPIERLQAFYRKYYQPDNAMLVIAGKFDEAKALSWIADSFGKTPRPERKLDKIYTEEPTQDGDRMVNVRRVGDVKFIMTAYHAPAGTHPDFPALQLLSAILGDNPSGRLYKALVDNKKVAGVGNFEMQFADPGLILFYAQLTKDQNLDEARATMLKVIEEISKEPPTKEEVERARAKIMKDFDLELSKSDRVGLILSEYASMGDWRMMFIDRDRMKSASLDDVQRVAKLYLKESNRTVGQFIPTEKPDRTDVPKTPEISSILKDYKGQADVAKGEVFDSSYTNIDARTKRVTLPNGLKLVMLSKQNRGGGVQAQIQLRMGTEQTLWGKGAIPSMTGSMLMRGTSKHTRQQIDDELSKLKARLNVGASATSATASIETVREHLADTLKLAAEVLRDPVFPDNELEQVRQSRIAAIDGGRREPNSIAGIEMQRHLYPTKDGDPREARTFDQLMADTKAVKLEDLKAFHKQFYGASHAIMTVVGDFDTAQIETLAKQLFGDWKSPTPYVRMTRGFQKSTPINRTFETPDKANAVFLASMRLPLSDESPDFAAAHFANYMFGASLSSRLWERLRQKEGFSYGTGSQISAAAKDEDGAFTANAILAPANIVKLEAAFKEEVEKVLKDGFSPKEVETARKAWVQDREVSRSQDGRILGTLSANEQWGRTYAFQSDFEKKVLALQLHDINNAFRKLISVDGLAIFKAGDFKKAGITQ